MTVWRGVHAYLMRENVNGRDLEKQNMTLNRLTTWLSFVMSNCEVVTFPLVSWVRCGT